MNKKDLNGFKENKLAPKRIIGVVVLLVAILLLFKVCSLSSTVSDLEDQTANLTTFLERKYPNNFIPYIISSTVGLKPIDDSSSIFIAVEELSDDAKKLLEEKGVTVVPVPMTPELDAKLKRHGDDFTHAYYLIIGGGVQSK